MIFNEIEINSAYILGIEKAYRGKMLEEDLQNCGITAIRVYGPDLREKSNVYETFNINRKIVRMQIHRDLLLGEIGCYIGHLQIYEEFLKTNQEWALVLEDDVKIVGDLSTLKKIEYPRIGKHILQLHDHLPNLKILKSLIDKSRIFVTNDSVSFQRIIRPLFGSSAYIINRAAAEFALEDYKKLGIYGTFDWPINWIANITYWRSDYQPFFHDTNGTNTVIDPKSIRLNDTWSSLRKITEVILYGTGLWSIRLKFSGFNFLSTYSYGAKIISYRIRYFFDKI